MSTQQPPPSNPPSYGRPPPSPGQSAPPGSPPPYGPPPKRRKSNITLIAIVTIVVLALVGGGMGGILLLGGDDSASGDDGGGTITGNGYSYTIPDGWDDASDQAAAAGIDSVVRAEDDDGFRTNILVEVQPASGTSDPEEIRAQWESNIGRAVGATPEPIDNTTIDGQEAIGVRVETEQEGIAVVQHAYLAINGDQVYSIAMSANIDVEDEATQELSQLLDSWSWT